MITTAYVAGLLTAVCLVVLVRLASGNRATEPPTQPDPEEKDDRPWRNSWQLRAQTCLEELRSAEDCTARIEALRWARRLHFERRAHAYRDADALEDAEGFWEKVNDEFRPRGGGWARCS